MLHVTAQKVKKVAINNDRNLLEQRILSNSGLKGKELENLKARLATLSEQQLQAELSKLLSGNNKGEWYTGITLEHSESVVIKSNHETTTFTDENGNEISELRDGNEVFERTIKSTDENGNVYITTVTFQSGKPLTQTKTKNGNTIETTTYRYNDDAEVPYVTVSTKKADHSKVMTNVLEVDENGNFESEDFIDRQATTVDGTTTHIFTENNCVIEQQVKPNGKKVDTLYKGDNIEDYDNKKLHRVYQRTELNGEVHEVAYDGNGNTRTVVQNGESPSAIAKKFGVKESSLLKLNPAKGENAITQVGADIVVPGEYNADSRVMKTRKTKQGAMQDYANDEVQRTAERLYSSTMQEVTLDKDYKDAYSYARALLAADGVKNPSNQQINNKANEILVANGNIKFTKGTKIQIAAKTTNSKLVQDLSNNGFKPTRENAIFYNRFNALNPSQQQNVLSVIKYCRSQKITDPNKIKARILETFPDINLFDSGKLIPMNSSFGTPVFQRKNPVALETFLTDTLKLDLKSEIGKMVYERLSSLPQDELNKIDGHNFADMSKANFNEIANSFETSGVNIRTGIENQMEQNTRVQRAERLGIPQQKFTSEMLANIYDRAADMMEQYYHNHGVFDAGTYLEGMKNLMDLVTPDNICGIDMRSTLHVASDCRKAAQRFRQMHTDNPETFKREYAQLKKDGLVTADYNQQNVQEFMNLIQSGDVDINSDKFKNACQKAFGFKGVENTEKYIQTGEMAGNIGDIVIMLYTLGAASELKMMGKATTGVYGALERGAGKIMGKTAAQKTAKVGTSMLMGGTTLGGFTLGKETLNNLSNPMRDATSWETWKETGIASAESFGFGFVGGLLNETVVAPIVKAIEKPATKATQAVSKALTEQGELTGKQIMETVSESGSLKLDGLFKMNSQEWVNFARTATAKGVGFGVEVSGFTAYEAGLDVIKDLIDPKTGRLPENMTVESLTEYLGEKFGEQFSNLGTIKGVSQLLMMSKGGKVAQKAMMNEILSKSEALKDIKFKKAEINGHEVYEVTYPNGNRAVVSSPEQAIATCQMAMQMEFLVKSLTDGEPKTEITRPQGMNAEEDAPIQKAHKENPAMILDETPQVKKSEATEGMPKENMNTSSVEHVTHESMSDAEFESLKLQLLENPNFPKSEDKSGYFRHKKFTRIDKDNILYAKNLLENSELSNLLGERTLSRLINNFGTDKNEASRILLQELQNTPDFFKNPNIEDGAIDNILSRTNSDKVQTQILLLQKLKNNPNLLKNSYISEKICDILSGVNSIKSLELVDKLFSKPERLENLINIDKILSVADNDYSISFAEKILEKPELFLAPDFVVFLPDLIKKCDSDITNNTKLELFNEFIKNSQNISDTELTNAFARAMHIGNNKVFDLRNKDNKLSPSELKTLELNSEKSLSSDLYENLFLELSKNEKFKDLSSKYYDLYLENEFKECSREDATRYREMCKSIDKEYGVKVILPTNLKEVGQSLILVYQELNNYKMHSNNQAKMPPVLDFMYPLADNAAGMAHIRDGINQIDVRELSTSFIKHSLRHEMAHINDSKQMDKFPTEIRTFKNEPKKDAWGELVFDVHRDLDINNCKYVDELRKGGISQKLIEYAYTNPMEFVAVASQGDFSKYSPEFKKYLTELGMPEWMLSFSNPKPYFISRENKSTKADEVNISEQSQRLNANNSNPAMSLEQGEKNRKKYMSEKDGAEIPIANATVSKTEIKITEIPEQISILTRLETANDRESFVAIRDEIKKIPNGEEKNQLLQAYLQKYNVWSADPARPDIRMQYIPEENDVQNNLVEYQTFDDLLKHAPRAEIKVEEMDEFLRLRGYSEEDITKLKNALGNDYAKYIHIGKFAVEVFGERGQFEGVEDIIENYNCIPEESKPLMELLNRTSIAFLSTKLCISTEEVLEILFEGDCGHLEIARKCYNLSRKTGVSIRDINKSIGNNQEKLLDKITPEQVLAYKNVSDILELGSFGYGAIEEIVAIKNPEKITKEFLEDYRDTIDRFAELGIYGYEVGTDPVEQLTKLKAIERQLKDNNIDLSWYADAERNHGRKIYLEQLENILQSKDISKISDFLSSCSDECKYNHAEDILQFAQDCYVNNPKAFAEMLNTIDKVTNGYGAFWRLRSSIDKHIENGTFDIEGVKEVAQAFIDTGLFVKNDPSAYAFFATDYNTNKPNYKGMAKFIRELKEFYNENSEYQIDAYMQDVWRGGHFDTMEQRFKQLKELGLYGKVAPHDLRCLLEEANNENIFNLIVAFHDEPLVKNEIFYYDESSVEVLSKRIDNLKQIIEESNTEYNNLSLNEKIELIRELNERNEFYGFLRPHFSDVNAMNINKLVEGKQDFALQIFNNPQYKSTNLNMADRVALFRESNKNNESNILNLITRFKDAKRSNSVFTTRGLILEILRSEKSNWLMSQNINDLDNFVSELYDKSMKNREEFVNNSNDKSDTVEFFRQSYCQLILLTANSSKEGVENLLKTKHIPDSNEYLNNFNSFDKSEMDLFKKMYSSEKPEQIAEIIDVIEFLKTDIKEMYLGSKIKLLEKISHVSDEILDKCRKYSDINIDAKIEELTISLGKKQDVVTIPFEQQQLFVKNVLANNSTNVENILKTFDFEQYEKKGLPLEYPREKFTANIENIIQDLSTEEQILVLSHFGLERGEAGFDGLPTNKAFDNSKASPKANEVAKLVQAEIEKFTTHNKIKIGDRVANEVLNGLIQGLPEFTSIVGKEQHGTHAYSVDIHTLKVLQSAMNNPLYEKLSDRDKTILKISALCHDFGKRGGVVDEGHANLSAQYVAGILAKFPFPQGMKDRIIGIVENHHWFEKYNTGRATAEDIAVRCRRPEDFIIYEILAKADFENVNETFHIERSDGVNSQAEFNRFMQEKMVAIDKALALMYSKSNLIFDTQFMKNGERFPKENIVIDGEQSELKVLNLNNLQDNANLQQYGFSTGVTKDNARFTVHMTYPSKSNMESVIILTQNSMNNSAWSTSLIKTSNNRTYGNEKFGFILDVDQANISEAYYENTGSGCGKDINVFKTILFEQDDAARTYVKNHLMQELLKKRIQLSNNEYALLSKFLMSKKYTTQITKDVKIGDKIIKASDLVECLESSRDALFFGGDIHSEIVSINPRVKGLIAKVEKLEECPEEFLQFAQKHNLPIILMKPTKEQ